VVRRKDLGKPDLALKVALKALKGGGFQRFQRPYSAAFSAT